MASSSYLYKLVLFQIQAISPIWHRSGFLVLTGDIIITLEIQGKLKLMDLSPSNISTLDP